MLLIAGLTKHAYHTHYLLMVTIMVDGNLMVNGHLMVNGNCIMVSSRSMVTS